MPDLKISIIIPAWNESPTIGKHVEAIRAAYPAADIMVVNDGSSDDTEPDAVAAQASIIHHPYRIGNGAAVKSGIRESNADVLVFMDGDGQHDPADITGLLQQMDRYHMVVGARTNHQHASLPRRFMNGVFNRLAAYVTGFPVRDLTSGFRAMRAETARDLLPMLPNGYSWPTTSTLVLLRSGMRVSYVPVNVSPRRHGRSRIRPVRDTIRFVAIIMKICTLYSPLRIFLPVSGTMFALGLVNYGYTFATQGRFTNMSALLFSSAVIIFMLGLVSEQISQISLLRHQVRGHETKVEAGAQDDVVRRRN